VTTYRAALTSDPEVLRGLEDLASSTGTTVEVVTFAIARLLLHFYTGQDDVLIGDDREPFTALLAAVARTHVEAPRHERLNEIVLRVVRSETELLLDVQYDPELFVEGTVARMAGVYAHLAQQIAARPGTSIRELELVPEDQRAELLGRFNDTSCSGGDVDADATINDLFADAVRRFPDHPAVAFQGSSLTYAQLDRRVHVLAHRLVRMGVRIGEPVALQLPPSLQTMIAMLAALRAGASYLPIDADLPPDRIRYLLEDSGARFLIGGPRATGALAFGGRLVDVNVDTDVGGDGGVPDGDARAALPEARASDGAYLIYTSGTTGSPKGVLIEHHSLVNYVRWFRRRYGIDDSHTAAILTSYAFDLGYTTLWTTILSGGCVHFLHRSTCEDAAAVARYFRDHHVTFIKVTPSLLSALISSKELDRESCGTLRLIVTGGERVRAADLETIYARLPDVLVVNHYGPTETTIGVTTYPVERTKLAEFARRPVIGRPIGNARAYVTTRSLQLLPIGAPGELIIAGRGVARGYLGRDDLTCEKFIPDPFGSSGAAYRSGDLARWTSEGTLEFLGRIDRQVKIRGYRIEPSEIEQVMLRRLGVAEAVVVPQLVGARAPVLCAYYVGGPRRAPSELRASLWEILPEYMVPAYFIELPALPRTENGKLDVRRLPEPSGGPVGRPEDLPRTETERVLQRVWSDVLGVDTASLGVSQNFFELGGHSLLMIQIIAEIDNHFGRTVPISTFYREGTIRALATILDVGLDAANPPGGAS
jgi:surfactin family lipopeptide synthetase B